MSKQAALLDCLDKLYGGVDVTTSHYKTTKQAYDNDKHEHVVYIEYRYRRDPASENKEYRRSVKNQQEKKASRLKAMRIRKQQTLNLLRRINDGIANDKYVAKTGASVPYS